MILDSLNEAQQQAVSAPLGHQLVLAGAGSGKTRVLAHRIAWLVTVEHLSPHHIMAVTFTNKAAHEMRSRIETMLAIPTRSLWVGTFHGLSHRLLRAHWQEAGLSSSFQILDADDQQRLLRRVLHTLNLNEQLFPPKSAQWFINKQKEEGYEPHQVPPHDHHTATLVKVYQAYQDACQRAGVIDFADLLLKVHRLFERQPALLASYHERFKCLLVDEFQDTNTIQYAWLRLLVGPDNYLTIVGDDDQSIYGWRGARIENIQRFTQDFPQATVTRLEQNYRSTGTILDAANALIAQNTGRLGKQLWTASQKGDPITIYAAFNEMDEAFFIVNRIREWQQRSLALRDIAVLYRSNVQSRVIEEALMQFAIPYRVYGGLRYFDRAEIRDALAYLRLLANHDDDPAFERIINTPPRGLGERTIQVIRDRAKTHHLSMWAASEQLRQAQHFPTRAHHALSAFMEWIHTLSMQTSDLALPQQIEKMLQASGLIAHYRQEKGEKGITRVENLEELINAADQFSQEGMVDDMPPLAAFLAYAALESSDEQAGTYESSVQLMTLHAAKGLEFSVVFLAGCEEELFPHYLSMQDLKALEEERRLCYVGMTRAMHKLYMTYTESRRLHGREVYHRPSRFLHELPPTLIEEIRFRTKVSRPKRTSITPLEDTSSPFRTGQTVQHHLFGQGIVLSCAGEGQDAKVTVRFAKLGTKTLIASYLSAK